MHPMGLLAVRSPEEAKTRLRGVLTADERRALAWAMYRHVLGCLTAALPPPSCIVISRSKEVLAAAQEAGAQTLTEIGSGQNEALTVAAQHALHLGATSLLSLSTDLPHLEVADLHAMLSAQEEAQIVLASDRHGTGTNAMCIRPPLAIPYLHGPDSFAKHCDAALAMGLAPLRIHRPGLAQDIDEATDLETLNS